MAVALATSAAQPRQDCVTSPTATARRRESALSGSAASVLASASPAPVAAPAAAPPPAGRRRRNPATTPTSPASCTPARGGAREGSPARLYAHARRGRFRHPRQPAGLRGRAGSDRGLRLFVF